jgi:NAD(P)-dependent dehydrogenase (short-subunit alcohol dehydrogenase family)
MDTFAGRFAVVTGGGSGMGRELVIKLAAEGCAVAACDVRQDTAEETAALARAGAPAGTTVTAHACDVADEAQVARFRDEALAAHGADHVDLVFSNAGLGGGGSFINDPREMWERVFAVDFWGVYHCARVFLPLLIRSPEGILVNTSSVNGFWASLGVGVPHTAYSTAKFAVKGFSEALIEDLRVNAPNVRVVLVMPGHVATNIVANSMMAFGVPEADAAAANQGFFDSAPLSAAGAAAVILDGVRSGAWRILVGEDAHRLDQYVRACPEDAYDYEKLAKATSGADAEDLSRAAAEWFSESGLAADLPRALGAQE